jgi:NTE family protein
MTGPTNAPTHRKGIALCLSGGGFRATLFHLGALRRLNELCVLGRLDAITSVSGGSIMAIYLADAIMSSSLVDGRLADFDALARKVHALTSCDLGPRLILERILPTNWGHTLAELLARELSQRATDKSLADLPASPQFIFCATDMAFGVNWTYARDRSGDYQAGYRSAGMERIQIAHASAASTCFPPFEPMDPLISADEFENGMATGADADRCRNVLRLCDGGVYDNMGLEPVWKSVRTLLVSDAGAPFDFDQDRDTLDDLKRYPSITGAQARDLRKRWLVECYQSRIGPGGGGDFGGTYWGTTTYRSEYQPGDTIGYSAAVAADIAGLRTDINTFSPAETAILENHGYLVADAALATYVPSLWSADIPPLPPYPEWMGPEQRVRAALARSSSLF